MLDWIFDNDDFEINEFETELSWISFTQQFFSTIIEAKNNNFNSDTKLKSSKNENDEYVKTLSLKTDTKKW